jgi:integrase
MPGREITRRAGARRAGLPAPATHTGAGQAAAGQLALPADLVDAARDYARAAHAPRTLEAYARAWAAFEDWCREKSLGALPAAPETIAMWMAALDKGDGNRKPLARSSIDQALSAVIVRHRDAGYPFDRKHPLIARTWKGISDTKAKTESRRQARPLLVDDLRALLGALRPQIPAEARDAALLAVGWAAALRRSELVGLDWQKLGGGSGFLRLDDRGVVVTLMASKASQDQAETIVVPCVDMPAACQVLETWVEVAALRPGQPVFRPVDQRQIIGDERLTDRSVARIVKSRVHKLARLRGRSETEADEFVALVSGHSLRAGYAISAAAHDMPGCRIQQHTRHKSAQVVAGYIREADKWTKSGLKGVGF